MVVHVKIADEERKKYVALPDNFEIPHIHHNLDFNIFAPPFDLSGLFNCNNFNIRYWSWNYWENTY